MGWGIKIERSIMEQFARKIDDSKEFRDFKDFREIMDTLSSIKRIKDEPHQKSTPKRQR
ncbi:MAG: hypothetical protein U9Q37_08445 [Euryarchaeota archaeon]|nr:hypothetical protein [Euryarchaeota archaeon]